MSSICGVCNLPLENESDTVKCSGSCGKLFHPLCVKDDTAGKKTRSNRDWTCKECRLASSTHSSTSSNPGTTISKEFMVKVLDQFKREVFAEIKNFKNEMSELAVSVKFVSEQLDSSKKLMETISGELASLKKENIELRLKNNILSTEVEVIKERMRSLEQYTRKNNLEISGIPVTPEENVANIVKDVGAALGVVVQDSQISAAHRIPSYRQDRTPAIIVQFQNRAIKDNLIGKFREKKTLCSNQVNKVFKQQKVFLNDHLSPENKQFLSKLKLKCKEIGYAYVWCRDGKFFVRKASGEKAKKISTYAELDKLK